MKAINPNKPIEYIPEEDQKAIKAGKMEQVDATVFTIKPLSYAARLEIEDSGADCEVTGVGKDRVQKIHVETGAATFKVLCAGLVDVLNFAYEGEDPKTHEPVTVQVVWPQLGEAAPETGKVYSASTVERARRRALDHFPPALINELANAIYKIGQITEGDAQD